jgi:phosphinothricin acetyltransferase
MSELRIRYATPEDAPVLLEIYAPYVTDTTITFEYTSPTAEEFAQRIRTTLRVVDLGHDAPMAEAAE